MKHRWRDSGDHFGQNVCINCGLIRKQTAKTSGIATAPKSFGRWINWYWVGERWTLERPDCPGSDLDIQKEIFTPKQGDLFT